MRKSSIPQDDDGENIKLINFSLYLAELQRCGLEILREQIMPIIKEGQLISYVIYTTVVLWVAEVTRSLQIPSVLFWAQLAAVLDIYYYKFNGYSDAIRRTYEDPLCTIELPGIPQLFLHNLPSFIQPSSKIDFAQSLLRKHIGNMKKELKVLVNTFDALEPEALKTIDELDLVAIGPLVPSALLDDHDPSSITYGGDLFKGNISQQYLDLVLL